VEGIIQRLLGSSRFWAVLISVVVPILNRKFDLGLSVEEVIAIIVGPNAWALGQSLRSSRQITPATALLLCLGLSASVNADCGGEQVQRATPIRNLIAARPVVSMLQKIQSASRTTCNGVQAVSSGCSGVQAAQGCSGSVSVHHGNPPTPIRNAVHAATQVALAPARVVAGAYDIALASAEYRAANRMHAHAMHIERGNTTGVGWASHDSNPWTCLGRPGFTSAACVVVRGPDGWYSTCVR